MPIPETRYARAGGVSIAYQVWGSGPVKVLFVPGGISAIDLWWEWPTSHHFFERLGSFATIAWFDKRGTGASDRLDGPASVEERSDDIRVMLAELGWERAVLWGNSEGGSMALLYAATHPDHVEALLLQGTFARFTWADDYPMGYTDEAARLLLDLWVDKWGTPETYTLGFFVPSQMGVPGYLEYLNRIERHSSPPSLHRAMMELNYQIDVRHAVPLVQCPSLVLHAPADRVVPVEHGRWLAEHIPDARLLEYEGEHFSCYVGVDEWVEAVENFLTGHASAPVTDRVLATVVFTTSSTPPCVPRSWATRHGERFSTATTRPSGPCSAITGATSSRPPETAWWRPSTARPPRCAPRVGWSRRRRRSAYRSGLASTPARWSVAVTTSPASPSTSPHEWALLPVRVKSSSPAPCRRSSSGRASPSPTGVNTISRASPIGGGCTPSTDGRRTPLHLTRRQVVRSDP